MSEDYKKKDIFDTIFLDSFDLVELDPEDKVLYSKGLKDIIHKEVVEGVTLAKKMLEKEVSEKIEESRKKDSIQEKLDKTSDKLKSEISSVEDKTKKLEKRIDTLKESHDKSINSLYSQITPQYQFGGFAPPNPADSSAGTFLKNSDQTWAGIEWGMGFVPKRVTSVADATSITPNADTTDIVTQINTQAAGTLTMNAPTGTPVSGQALVIRIKSTNVQTFSWNAIYRAVGSGVLPSSTDGSSATNYYSFLYNSDDTKWDLTGYV